MDNVEFITQAIQRYLRDEIKRLVEEKSKEILQELFKEADKIALHILSHYSITDFGHEIRITVKKEQEEVKMR